MTDTFRIKKTDTLYEIYKSGIITHFMSRGLISVNRAVYFRYYEVFQAHLNSNNKTESVKLSAEECGVDEMTIWRAIKAVEEK